MPRKRRKMINKKQIACIHYFIEEWKNQECISGCKNWKIVGMKRGWRNAKVVSSLEVDYLIHKDKTCKSTAWEYDCKTY